MDALDSHVLERERIATIARIMYQQSKTTTALAEMNRTAFVWSFCVAYRDRIARSGAYDAALADARTIRADARIALFRAGGGVRFGVVVVVQRESFHLYKALINARVAPHNVMCRVVGV